MKLPQFYVDDLIKRAILEDINYVDVTTDYLIDDKKSVSLTLLEESLVSHKMAFLSEESRLEDGASKKIN